MMRCIRPLIRCPDEVRLPEAAGRAGDFSIAAVWLGLAAVLPARRLIVRHVALEPTRLYFVDLLLRMGARVREEVACHRPGEWSGTLDIRGGGLRGIEVPASHASALGDDVGLLAVVAAKAEGRTIIGGRSRYPGERIRAITDALRTMGVYLTEEGDSLVIHGRAKLRGTLLKAEGDAGAARGLLLAGLLAEGESVLSEGDMSGGLLADFFHSECLGEEGWEENPHSFFSSV